MGVWRREGVICEERLLLNGPNRLLPPQECTARSATRSSAAAAGGQAGEQHQDKDPRPDKHSGTSLAFVFAECVSAVAPCHDSPRGNQGGRRSMPSMRAPVSRWRGVVSCAVLVAMMTCEESAASAQPSQADSPAAPGGWSTPPRQEVASSSTTRKCCERVCASASDGTEIRHERACRNVPACSSHSPVSSRSAAMAKACAASVHPWRVRRALRLCRRKLCCSKTVREDCALQESLRACRWHETRSK